MGGQRTAALLRWGTIPLRLIVGYGFMAHGVAKIVNGPGRFMDILQALGVPAPHLMGWATIVMYWVEFIGPLIQPSVWEPASWSMRDWTAAR